MASLRRSVAALAATLILASCGEVPTEAPASGASQPPSVVQLLGAHAIAGSSDAERYPLGSVSDLLGALDHGECVLEWDRTRSLYVRIPYSLAFSTEEPTAWRPFVYGYRTHGGTILYRATCKIPVGTSAQMAAIEELHVPGLMGDLPAAAPAQSTSQSSSMLVVAGDCVSDPDSGPCDGGEIIVEGEDPCPAENEFWMDGAGCVCEYNCQTDSSGGTDDGSGGGSTTTDPNETEPDSATALKLTPNESILPDDPDCNNKDMYTDAYVRALVDAFCYAKGKTLSADTKTRIKGILDAMGGRSAECKQLADEGHRLLAMDSIGIFPTYLGRHDNSIAYGTGSPGLSMVIVADTFIKVNPPTLYDPGVGKWYKFPLDAALAHELEHKVFNVADRETQSALWLHHTKECAGLP